MPLRFISLLVFSKCEDAISFSKCKRLKYHPAADHEFMFKVPGNRKINLLEILISLFS